MNTIQITIAGHTSDAPEVRFTPNGKANARMRVAVNSRYQDNTGTWVDGPTSWYTVLAWGQLAENVAESISKGDRVLVHGRLEQRDYETEAGEKRSVWELTADEIGISLRHATAQPTKTTRTVTTGAGAPF
jgi:single-strand DNA-binding protein